MVVHFLSKYGQFPQVSIGGFNRIRKDEVTLNEKTTPRILS